MKPLLAYTVEDTSTLKYPLFASVKLDRFLHRQCERVERKRALPEMSNRIRRITK